MFGEYTHVFIVFRFFRGTCSVFGFSDFGQAGYADRFDVLFVNDFSFCRSCLLFGLT